MDDTNELDDESRQAVDWRMRLIEAILNRYHDDETLVAMLEAGLNQAHSEGLISGALLCEDIAGLRIASAPTFLYAAKCIRDLDALNQSNFEISGEIH